MGFFDPLRPPGLSTASSCGSNSLGEVWSLLVHLGLFWGGLYDACIKNACSKASGRSLGSPSHENKNAQMHFRLEISFIEIVVLWN